MHQPGNIAWKRKGRIPFGWILSGGDMRHPVGFHATASIPSVKVLDFGWICIEKEKKGGETNS